MILKKHLLVIRTILETKLIRLYLSYWNFLAIRFDIWTVWTSIFSFSFTCAQGHVGEYTLGWNNLSKSILINIHWPAISRDFFFFNFHTFLQRNLVKTQLYDKKEYSFWIDFNPLWNNMNKEESICIKVLHTLPVSSALKD